MLLGCVSGVVTQLLNAVVYSRIRSIYHEPV